LQLDWLLQICLELKKHFVTIVEALIQGRKVMAERLAHGLADKSLRNIILSGLYNP
jgi:hypothetical protein